MYNRRYQPFKTKILAAVVIANMSVMAIVAALPHILPEPRGSRALREVMAAIERSAAKEKTVTGAVIEVSRLAERSGYELAVKNVIKDHDANMASLKENADVLADIGNPYENNLLVTAMIAVIGAQACCLFSFLMVTSGEAEEEAEGMSRRIDDMLAVKKPAAVKLMKDRTKPEVRINGRLKN